MLAVAAVVEVLDQPHRPAADEVPRPDKCRNADCPQQEAFDRFLELLGLDGAGQAEEDAGRYASYGEQPHIEADELGHLRKGRTHEC